MATHAPTVVDPSVTPLDDLGGSATVPWVRSLIESGHPLTVSILGDSTGNGPDEWVHLWAQHLAESRAVTYYAWDDTRGAYDPAEVLSTDGPKLVIWNGSAPGRVADYPSTQLEEMQPTRPDFVLFNFGHNNTAITLATGLYATLSAMGQRWGAPIPSVAILQNPERGDTAARQADTVGELRHVIAPALGLPTIDVWAAFAESPQPLADLITNVDGLGVHPSEAGSQVWAQAVTAALG